ncbi:hypothetical protein ACL9RF_14415 [Sphingobacterium sp. Mn56C]|uniref:hypothetical protein n=1 Tax=Sphingobacterium sp. Mn56C TaxID=3395261 RepID=UPI003BC37022
MLELDERIARFMVLLRQRVGLQDEQVYPDKIAVYTGKMWLWIYAPTAARQADHSTVPTIHLDVDLLGSSAVKIINRLRGMHGLGERIYARETVVARLDKNVTMDFLDAHHLQGAMPGKYRYGLFADGELVSIAVFSGARILRNLGPAHRSFELIRFCHKNDTLVIGGISKLLNAFIKDFAPQDIMTYADRDWCKDSSLEAIGFHVVGEIGPQQFAVYQGERFALSRAPAIVDYYVSNKGSLKLKRLL